MQKNYQTKNVSRKHPQIRGTPLRYANGITEQYAPHTDQARPTGGRDTAKEKKRLKQCECLSRKKIPGAVLLSHSQIYSTIAAGALNYRVREGNVCFCSAMDAGK